MATGSWLRHLWAPTLVAALTTACFSKPSFTGRDGPAGDGRGPDGASPDAPLRGPNVLPEDAVFDRKPTVADVDGDGYDDLVVHGQSTSLGSKFFIWISYGGPGFNPAQFTQAISLDDLESNAPDRAGEVAFALEPVPGNSTGSKVPLLLAVTGASPNGDGTFNKTIAHVFVSADGGKSFSMHHTASSTGRAAYDPVVPGVAFLQHSVAGIAERLFFGTEIGRFSVPVLAASSFALDTSSEPDLVIELIPSNTGPIADIGSILFGMEEPTTRTLIEFGTQGAYRQVPASAPTLSNMELRFRMNTYLYKELPFQKLVGRTTLPTLMNSYFIGAVTDADWALRMVLLKLGTSDNIFQLSVTVQTGGRLITEIGDLAIDPHQAEANVVVLGHESGSGGGNPLRRFGVMPALNTVLQSAAEIAPMAATPVAPLWAADTLSQDYDMVVTGRFQSKTESQSWVLATAQRGNPPQCYKFVGMQLSRC